MAGTAYPKKQEGVPPVLALVGGIAAGSVILLAVAVPYRLGYFSSGTSGSSGPVSTASIAPPRDLSTPTAIFSEAERFYPYGSESVADRSRAAELYRAFADAHPRDPRGPEALLRLSEVLDFLNDVEGEIRALDDFRIRYPSHGRMPYVLYGLGHLHRVMGREEIGDAFYRQLILRHPGTSDAEQAKADLGISGNLETEGNSQEVAPTGYPE